MAVYIGGPCDGRTVPATIYPQSVCSGATYLQHEDGNYYSALEAGGPVGPGALGTHGPRGWADLRQAINTALPTGTSRAKVLTRAAHRKLMQRRRLR